MFCSVGGVGMYGARRVGGKVEDSRSSSLVLGWLVVFVIRYLFTAAEVQG